MLRYKHKDFFLKEETGTLFKYQELEVSALTQKLHLDTDRVISNYCVYLEVKNESWI